MDAPPFRFGRELERLSGSPSMALATAGQLLMGNLRRVFEEHDLSPRQFRTLDLLADRGATGQFELGELLGVDRSVLVVLLNPLEDAGLLSRDRDPADRRRHLVSITPAGGRRLREGAAAMQAFEDRMLAGLTDDQRAELTRSLSVVVAALGGPGDPLDAGGGGGACEGEGGGACEGEGGGC